MANARNATVKRVDAWLEGTASRFPAAREAVIPLLQSAQAEFGYVPTRAIDGIARMVRLPAATVQGIATFYAQFRFKPPGRHSVTVCRGTACHVRGSGRVLEELQRLLRTRPQETTSDGMFSLDTVACFGSCALAPVMVVDRKVFGRQTAATAPRTIRRIRGGATARARRSAR